MHLPRPPLQDTPAAANKSAATRIQNAAHQKWSRLLTRETHIEFKELMQIPASVKAGRKCDKKGNKWVYTSITSRHVSEKKVILTLGCNREGGAHPPNPDHPSCTNCQRISPILTAQMRRSLRTKLRRRSNTHRREKKGVNEIEKYRTCRRALSSIRITII